MAAANTGRVFQFKLVLLGDSAVGKSSLVLRFVRGQFFEYQESTIGAAFLTQTVALNDTTVKFEIWDTAGQERYHSLAPMYYRGAAAAIVVFDITNRVRRRLAARHTPPHHRPAASCRWPELPWATMAGGVSPSPRRPLLAACCPVALASPARASWAQNPSPAPPQDTFQRAKQWVKELQRQGNPNIVRCLRQSKRCAPRPGVASPLTSAAPGR